MDYLSSETDFSFLSLADLLVARDQFHLHLIHKPNVIGTAVGRYRIRKSDPWPDRDHPHTGFTSHGRNRPARNLQNSEVRPYSWPAILVFVKRWVEPDDFQHPEDAVPPAVYLPDGHKVPICVIEADRDEGAPEVVPYFNFPDSVIGGGYPVVVDVQGREHVASLGCLVTDGHRTYALTNRHVAGEPGSTIYSVLQGNRQEIGKSARLQLTRELFTSIYPEWPGNNVYVDLDIGLIDISDLENWTTQIYGIGEIGELADLDASNLSLRIIGCPVRAFGAASGAMSGEICALFYRFKSVGGFEYISDLLVGPRGNNKSLGTRPGDSGTLWTIDAPDLYTQPRPIALQWGGQVFIGEDRQASAYALATLLSTACNKLDVTILRDWNTGLPDYWGTVGHFTIANMACGLAGAPKSNLRRLLQANLTNITFPLDGITVKGTQGLSKKDFVPLADVPDLVWKMPSGTGSRGPRGRNPEQPNHFADMDQPPRDGTPTLLDLCKDEKNIDPEVWIEYARKFPAQAGKPADPAKSMGLLPFRIWQIYDKMVEFVKIGQRDEFICAAGTLAHYVGDACQPLHISYLHHGDPVNFVTRTVQHSRGQHAGTSEDVNVSANVHEDYEQTMFRNAPGEQMKTQLRSLLSKTNSSGTLVVGGRGAAVITVQMMQATFNTIPPRSIVDTYDGALRSGLAKADILALLWKEFGVDTVRVMSYGCRLLALLWESAWAEGDGDTTITTLSASRPQDLAALYDRKDFLPSYLLTEIGAALGGETPTSFAHGIARSGRGPGRKAKVVPIRAKRKSVRVARRA